MAEDYIKRAYCEALLSLSDEKKIGKISIVDVLERAGTARQTFYNRFRDINELISYIPIHYVDESFRNEPDPKKALNKMYSYGLEHKSFFCQLPFHNTQNNFYDTFLQRCYEISLERAHLKESDKSYTKKRLAIYLYAAGHVKLFLEWCRNGMDIPHEIIVDVILESRPSFLD